ncbi:MAG: carbon-nitrogen hydrolase family protein [Candidatus Latescibacteria bacterium]|jgi:predicted amidohydrolase|nr:carbon-nitrogen hydrolase family protein [Candidatus Latescibacterota bacterium]
MPRITIASVQPPVFAEKSSAINTQIIEAGFRYLEEGLQSGASIACLPEYFNVFGVSESHMLQQAEHSADLLTRTQEIAAAHRAYVILPLLLRQGERFRNRAHLIGPSGSIEGSYDKTHPTLGEIENLSVEAGQEIKVFDTEHGRIALVICYDIYFPELFAKLTDLKPDIIFLPSLQRSDHEMASEAILKTRAMDTKSYFVRSSYGCPIDVPWKAGMMFGQSAVIHPDGTVLSNAGHYEGLALARITIPFEWRRQRCGGYPAMGVRNFLAEDRRPDVYQD